MNFENPNLNVGLPLFTIHGNHDDPAGQDNLSAVDLLSSCGLVNYFGKVVSQPRVMVWVGNSLPSPVGRLWACWVAISAGLLEKERGMKLGAMLGVSVHTACC